MGLKMPKAYSEELKRDVTIEEATRDKIKDELYCSNGECRIPLTFVDMFRREGRPISAYFRRRGKVEHIEKCSYNTLGQLNIAARESDDALVSLNDKKYKLRLNLISEAINSSNPTPKKESTEAEVSNIKQPTKNYISSGEISAYLSTMKKIMQIKAKIEDESELKKTIEIQFNNENIKWSDFYFENDNYKECFSKLMNKRFQHPICIEGKIKGFEEANKNFPYHSIKFKLKHIGENEEGKKKFVSISILLDDQKIYENLKKEFESGKRNIAFCSNVRAKRVINLSEFLNITGVVYNIKQIYMF